MDYAELTVDILSFSRKSAADLKCKLRHNADFVCCASHSLTQTAWKIGVLKKPYLPRNIWGLNVYVPQPTVEEDFTCPCDGSEDEGSDIENIDTPNSTSTFHAVLPPSVHQHAVHTISRVFLGNVFWNIIKADPSFKLQHMQKTLRSYLKRKHTLQFNRNLKESVLKLVYGNEDEHIGKLAGALQLLEANGYKTHFEVFTAKQMIS